ncbi:MAG: glycosyltransferase [bacterium]|nr:glycosyltransferase [bacterium]
MLGSLARLLRRLGRRTAALDFASPAGEVGEDSEPGPVDVIVPVHGAAAATARCLASLARHTDFTRHRLVVVVDGDPDFAPEALEPLAGQTEPLVLENDTCRGFVASVNRGMAASGRDVVLLNSDTAVTPRWLEKLQEAAYSAPAIATVTPFSNNATICSLPRPAEVNALPPGHDVESFGSLVEEVSARERPRIPSGVGMCLYIKRRALDQVGPFDEASFGAGYGEETDFCFRALEAGFVHVLDDATFIFHEGQQSFGAERLARVRRAERELERRHPEYVATIAGFLTGDPLRPARDRVLRRLTPERRVTVSPAELPRVLHVVHGWPPYAHGGSELYAYWLVARQQERFEVAVYARVADATRRYGEATEMLDGRARVRLVVNNFSQRSPLSRNALRSRRIEADFDRFVADFRPDLIHVHHLSGHGLSLLGRAAASGASIVYQIQDWWALCARANLWRPDRSLCSGPTPARCSACLPLTRLPPAPIWNRLLYRYRAALARRLLRLVDAYVMGSRAIERDYRAAGLLAEGDRVHVLAYGVRPPSGAPREGPPGSPLRFGYVGTIMPHKGVHVAVESFAGTDSGDAVLEIWGDPSAAPEYTRELERAASPEVVRFRGTFAEADRGDVFARFDVLLMPSLGLESFGLVAREAMARGVPVVASRRGALAELFPADAPPAGALVEPGDVAELRALVEELVARPETVEEWRRVIAPVVGVDEHAAAIERVYAEVSEKWEAR